MRTIIKKKKKKRMLPKKKAEFVVLFVVGLSILRPSLSSKALERSNRTSVSVTALPLMRGVG